jgi:hypothetical protein
MHVQLAFDDVTYQVLMLEGVSRTDCNTIITDSFRGRRSQNLLQSSSSLSALAASPLPIKQTTIQLPVGMFIHLPVTTEAKLESPTSLDTRLTQDGTLPRLIRLDDQIKISLLASLSDVI